MINSRVSKRAGYNVLKGATNPKCTVNDVAPLNPKTKDMWFDTTIMAMKYWDGDSWEQIVPIVVGTTAPTDTTVLWYDTN